MAVCDAHYRFTYASTGSAGKESDGGIFRCSNLKQRIEDEQLRLPPARPPKSPVGSRSVLPPVIVGDAAFPLKEYLMRPYPGKNLAADQEIFNYRLSRARRVIENTFGVYAARWRIFRKPIIASLQTINNTVLCCAVLHNWLRNEEIRATGGQRRYMPPDFVDRVDRDGNVVEGGWREEGEPQGLNPIPADQARNSRTTAKDIRRRFTEYFMTEGHVPWQWNKLPAHERDLYREIAEEYNH